MKINSSSDSNHRATPHWTFVFHHLQMIPCAGM